jgi:hypothetical protein
MLAELLCVTVRRRMCAREATFCTEWLDLDRSYLASYRRRCVGRAAETLAGLWHRLSDAGDYDIAAQVMPLILRRPEGL